MSTSRMSPSPAVRSAAKHLRLILFVASLCALAHAATPERAIMVREAVLYLSPDPTSQKIATVGRGREVAIIEASGQFAHVLANVETGATDIHQEEYAPERNVTGWLLNKGIIRTSTPNGDQILYGEAVDSEAQAERRGGRKGAANDALRLYARLAEYFPKSPYAGEAAWRAADIRWQLEKSEVRLRPSSRLNDPSLRAQMSEDELHQVEHKFPHTKWADLAAFDLLENKLCGDWLGTHKCPDKEAEHYEKYAIDHPESPKLAEALYEAAWRRAALVEIYKTEAELAKSAESRTRAQALAQRILALPKDEDWSARAQTLLYKIEQNIPTWGNATE